MSEIAKSALGSMGKSIDKLSEQLATFASKDNLSETDMIQFNMQASEYSTMMSLTSGLIKTLTEAEQSVAQKM